MGWDGSIKYVSWWIVITLCVCGVCVCVVFVFMRIPDIVFQLQL